MTILPLFKYPVTIVWIDDDLLFLKTIKRTLGKYCSIKTFNDPEEGIQFIKSYSPFLSKIKFLRACTEHESYDTLSHMPVDLNIKKLSELFLNTDRYDEISILVVDYKMPGMDGIEVCRFLKNFQMKKILLTGEADHPKAVNAFNEGIIDRYIRKDTQNLSDQIKEHINSLNQQYFYENTRLLLSHLEVEQRLPVSDPVFISFFNKLCEERKIKEYYLIDKYGSFCIVDEDKNIFYLIIHTEKTLNTFVEVYRDAKWAQDLLEKTKRHELVPFFGINREAWEVNENEWDSCFYKPYVLDGENQRYFIIQQEKN